MRRIILITLATWSNIIILISAFHTPQRRVIQLHITPMKISSKIKSKFDQKSRIMMMETRSDNDSGEKILALPSAAVSSKERSSTTKRKVGRVEKFARLPVWPAWNGVAIFIISRIFGDEVAAKLEDAIGGRVCPNFFAEGQTSPFIMLVHHRHSFARFDVLRYLQRTFFPEGFPAHPHRGFTTVTYILKGGFLHRDSMGIKQSYGAEKRHGGKHTQWLKTGGGMLHEEMFDMDFKNFFQPCDQELYQLWVNIPANQKLTSPTINLLGGEEETPSIKTIDDNGKKTETIVIAGSYEGKSSMAPIQSDLAILHVKLDPGTSWSYSLPRKHETVILYIRKGAIQIEGETIPTHHTAYLTEYGSDLVVRCSSDNDIADFLILSGEPLGEPVSAQGSMVMNSPDEINLAYSDYQRGKMGLPWSEELSDEEWLAHVKKYPNFYHF